MSSYWGQLEVAIDEEEYKLFPYPEKLTADHFSMNHEFDAMEMATHHLQVEFKLISPIEFQVNTSRKNKYFYDIVLDSSEHLKYRTLDKSVYPLGRTYEFNLKHYTYIFSRVEYLRYECSMTINWNHFKTQFIDPLVKNVGQNNKIRKFIKKSKSGKNEIIDSLETEPKFGKWLKLMSEHNMFDNLYENQTIAFYMSVIRDGKSILADKKGKSLTALMIMTYFRDDWPLVIVCDRRRKEYWNTEINENYKCGHLLRIAVIHCVEDIYVYPKPFHHIMIIDYDFYYEIKDTLSFRNLGLKAFIFEDQSRGLSSSGNRQWKGLSKAFDNLKDVNRIIFVSSKPYDPEDCKHLWPLLHILDPKMFQDFEKFEIRYCDSDFKLWSDMIIELQILLRSTFLIRDNN